ncbi:exodeoxyribonuclease I [Flammeovirga sp. OC4]|uniref:exodeoxyribonuclease I n=1 Tax=Flammeovirga sp. OC4 TaxID=1382345 RepID=UPI0005C71AEC|nr:exodeoxyribonuclease I [Flammeovirga sp. OC4]
MNTTSFFFYDYETFGKDPKKDKIAQFAGIRTDLSFNPIGDPIVLYCKPSKDFLPDPEACLVTGITPQIAEAQGVSEFEFMGRIKNELGLKGTCHIGYNNIRFDDEFSRFGFYKNFIDPYSHEWADQNSRLDLLDIIRMTYALRPDGIQWPTSEDGSVNLKLENLSKVNGIEHENAHDALADVWATIHMAKLVEKVNPKLFNYAFKLRDKKVTQKLVEDSMQTVSPLLFVTPFVPLVNGHLSFFVPLSKDLKNNNAYNGIDILTSPLSLKGLSADEIRERLYEKAKDDNKIEDRPGIRQVVINKSSMFVTPKTLSPQRAKALDIDLEKVKKHQLELEELIKEDPSFVRKVNEVYNTPYPINEDVDGQLYEGFIDGNDKRLGNRVTAMGKTDPKNLSLEYFPFRDDRLKEMLFRYKGRNFYDALSPDELKVFKSYCRAKVMDGIGGGTPLNEYVERVSDMINSSESNVDKGILTSLLKYAELLEKELNK